MIFCPYETEIGLATSGVGEIDGKISLSPAFIESGFKRLFAFAISIYA